MSTSTVAYEDEDEQYPIRRNQPGQCAATATIGLETLQCLLTASRHTKHRAQVEYRVRGVTQRKRGYFHWSTDKPVLP